MNPRSPRFVTTSWTTVFAARDRNAPESRAALETLCRTYWFPLYAYARRSGLLPHDAEDATQAFFVRLLDKGELAGADRTEERFLADTASPPDPDAAFEHRWARTLLDRTMTSLKNDYEKSGSATTFEALKPYLAAGRGDIPYRELAERTGLSEGAARVAVSRMRARFRELFRETVAETVSDPAETDAEMRHVARVLSE